MATQAELDALEVQDRAAFIANQNALAGLSPTYVPTPTVITSRAGLASRMADMYVPPATPAAKSNVSRGTSGRSRGTSGRSRVSVTGSTDTPAQTTSTVEATPAPAVAVQQPIAYTPQVGSGGVQLVRQPTPCELGQGGCQSPHEVSSHVAQWELDGNQPLSIRSAAFLYPLLEKASTAERSAAQAGAANLYDRALADPALEGNVQALQAQGVPYGLALAQARKDATDSGYARMLMGQPQVIAAQDTAASVDQAAAAAAGAPYVDRFGRITGYYPQVTKFDPTAGTLTVNNANYTGTGLSGVDVPLAADTISGGLPRYAATARSGISAVTNQTNKLEAAAAKGGTNLAVEQAKADIHSNAAVKRIEAQQKSNEEFALYSAGIKNGTIKPPAPPPLVQVK